MIIVYIYIGKEFSSIEDANKILAIYNCVIVEEKKIIITSDDGQKLEISEDKARELGFEIK